MLLTVIKCYKNERTACIYYNCLTAFIHASCMLLYSCSQRNIQNTTGKEGQKEDPITGKVMKILI